MLVLRCMCLRLVGRALACSQCELPWFCRHDESDLDQKSYHNDKPHIEYHEQHRLHHNPGRHAIETCCQEGWRVVSQGELDPQAIIWVDLGSLGSQGRIKLRPWKGDLDTIRAFVRGWLAVQNITTSSTTSATTTEIPWCSRGDQAQTDTWCPSGVTLETELPVYADAELATGFP